MLQAMRTADLEIRTLRENGNAPQAAQWEPAINAA